MIKKAEYKDALIGFGDSAFICRIRAAADAYGLSEPFAQFWVQDENAVICKLDDAVILEAGENADLDEIFEFIRMTGAKRLLCAENIAKQAGLPAACRGEVMQYRNTMPPAFPNSAEINPGIREIYALLRACETPTFVPPEFEPFYLDLSHRIRHGAALAAGIRCGGELVSCAVCIAKTDSRAVVSAVAVKPEQQRKGFGSAALSALISQLKQENINIFRAENENEEFYRAFGFVSCGEFQELII